MKPSLPLLFSSLCLAAPTRRQEETTLQTWPEPTPGTFVIPDFTFDTGEKLDELEIHYKTLGNLQVNEDGTNNAVFIMHGSSLGSSEQFLVPEFAGTLFNPGQVLDTEKYFIILRDGIGHGNSSTPRNTGLHANFPGYQYSDMVRADYMLLTEHLQINHTRLTMGVSMGGMHTWMWGELYPDFMDALFPIACLPAQIAGQNRLWRKMFIELIRNDPAYNGGEYTSQPMVSLTGSMSLLQIMFEGPIHLMNEYPTRDLIDAYYDEIFEDLLAHPDDYDVNNQIFAWNASNTYDPSGALAQIKAPLTAVNTEDDMMNPPGLGILEDAIANRMTPGVGKAYIVPTSNETYGHASYIKASLWEDELLQLLAKTGHGRV